MNLIYKINSVRYININRSVHIKGNILYMKPTWSLMNKNIETLLSYLCIGRVLEYQLNLTDGYGELIQFKNKWSHMMPPRLWICYFKDKL